MHALDGSGKEILSRDFTVTTAMQPYNGVIPRYEEVQVDTGWVRLEVGSRKLLDERIQTDAEEYWDHYQNTILPRIYHFVMAQAHGDLRPEFAPPFDTLKIDIHMSEPDYALDLDKERISSLEALQEDTFYSTDTFINMMGDLETGRPINYIGRVIPIVHASEDGQDGHVHIEFYGKPAANPLVRLSWTDAQGQAPAARAQSAGDRRRNQPRLIAARVRAGQDGVESLTWSLPADYVQDDYEQWLKVEGQDQVDRTIFSVEQAEGELHWLEQMHAAGLYRDELAYPHLRQMAMEFELPPALDAEAEHAGRPRVRHLGDLRSGDAAPDDRRHVESSTRTPIVQWDEPISPEENTAILARFATYSRRERLLDGPQLSRARHLGCRRDAALAFRCCARGPKRPRSRRRSSIPAASTPTKSPAPATLISWPKQLITDPAKRALLKQVNVVMHPINNPDGAQLSVDLAKITPDNMLHPGYHGSLSADVSAGQGETDPVYPESRTRKQLIDAWLPDAFLNPHGYPSHEWVQPFSEYTGWVQSRQGANPGRAWWIPRGWFTSLGYLRDRPSLQHARHLCAAGPHRGSRAQRARPAAARRPHERPLRALRPALAAARHVPADRQRHPHLHVAERHACRARRSRALLAGSGGVGGISADVTWDAGYTEAPDETAHGDYMKLMASAGLAFDYVHLKYLADGDLRITRTEREVPGGVQWRVERTRPILPDAPPDTKQP